jgi:hypothetical protein
MRHHEISLEARRNPEKNPQISVNDHIYDALVKEKSYLDTNSEDNKSIKNLYVSFTKEPKLGINPKSKYNTPLGIYAYPASYVVTNAGTSRTMRSSLPFAGDQPWVNIFTLKDVSKVLVISNPEVDYEPYYKKLATAFRRAFDSSDIEKWRNDSETEALFKTPGGKFWYVTMMAARSLAEKMYSNKIPLYWNLLFRRIGIDAVVDDGSGVIHENEQTQMVVFDPTAIKMIDRVENKYSPDTRKDSFDKQAIADKVSQEFKQVPKDFEHLSKFFKGSIYKRKMIKFVEPELRRYILADNPELLVYYPTATEDDIFTAISNDIDRLPHLKGYYRNVTPALITRLINSMNPRVDMREFLGYVFYKFEFNDPEYLMALVRKEPKMIEYILNSFGVKEIDPRVFQIAYLSAKRKPLLYQDLINDLESGPYLDTGK